MTPERKAQIHLALPKGRIQDHVIQLMADAGVEIVFGARAYRPYCSLAGYDVKLLKPQNILRMLSLGSRDIGFAGLDWVEELGVEVVELLDTGLDPVRIVAAAADPAVLSRGNNVVIATEYEKLTRRWAEKKGLRAEVIRSYGVTEVFPPEDADLIVDNTATGGTLAANNLTEVDELLTSSTRLFANPIALEDPAKRARIEELVVLLKSVLDARERVLMEMNVSAERLEELVKVLPCMRYPTISPLYGDQGFAVKVAVPRRTLPQLIPVIKAHGGTDLVVMSLTQLIK